MRYVRTYRRLSVACILFFLPNAALDMCGLSDLQSQKDLQAISCLRLIGPSLLPVCPGVLGLLVHNGY
jgi:hypothetical protein